MSFEAPTVAEFERAGVTILVTENGWIGQAPDGGKLYALALGQHNGAGWWPVGDEDRFTGMGVSLKPWRRNGGHLLALGQRGFGPQGIAAPKDWLHRIPVRLRGCTVRPIQLRAHPGRVNPRPNLEPALADCWAVLTWSSGAAVKAIAAGIPAFHDMPNWIGAPAAKHGFSDLERPFLGDRMPMFHRLSHAQWSVDELASGEPFARILGV